MDAQTDFPDTCECATFQDNGAGLSWDVAIPAGQSRTVSHLTNFSPLGNTPLVTTKTADSPTVAAGAQDGYTITVSNPNATIAALASVTDVLPAGFSVRRELDHWRHHGQPRRLQPDPHLERAAQRARCQRADPGSFRSTST